MGIPFSESTNNTGLYEQFLEATQNDSTSFPIERFTIKANMALSWFLMKAIISSQKWQVDDSNHSDYNILKINIVSGQKDYPFTTDASTPANQVLNILKAEIYDNGGNGKLLTAYDPSEEKESYLESLTKSGTPTKYDKFATGIFFDVTPNYSYASGLWVWISRTANYFLSTDTTKQAGIPDHFHDYLWLKPAYDYCIIHIPELASGYLVRIKDIESEIGGWYFQRNKDEKKRMLANVENTR